MSDERSRPLTDIKPAWQTLEGRSSLGLAAVFLAESEGLISLGLPLQVMFTVVVLAVVASRTYLKAVSVREERALRSAYMDVVRRDEVAREPADV